MKQRKPTHFTRQIIEDKLKAGTIRGVEWMERDEPKKIPAEYVEPKPVTFIKELLSQSGIEFVEEHKFCDYRRFRFDIAIISTKTAIEYEGLFSKKSRHTTVDGYSKDAEKYNLAVSMGWKVYRYTQLNYKNFELDIKSLIN